MKNLLLFTTALILMWGPLGCNNETSEKETPSEATQTRSVESGAMKALIVDGQNNHDMWPKISIMMKTYLEESGMFEVDIERTAFTWKGDKYLEDFALKDGKPTTSGEKPQPDPNYAPNFSQYDVVISNFGWNASPWPEATQKALEAYVSGGGGLVIIHAANNSFPEWGEFNKMIGLGGWGDRNEKDGPYVYYNDAGELVRDTSPGKCGSHGPQHEFQVMLRDKDHPIVQGMPESWLHAQDELYAHLRGPAENMNILATAYSAEDHKGTGRHEPMIMTLDYGQGRVFHTPMGHADYSVECVGFITAFQRGTEWAATGKVSQTELPADFPTADAVSQRKFGGAE